MRRKLIYVSIIFIVILNFSGCNIVKQTEPPAKNITLNFWGVWDDSDAYSNVIAKFEQKYPQVNIQYRKLDYEDYEEKIQEAFAYDEKNKPDIFLIHNTWTKKYLDKGAILPLPVQTTMIVPVLKGSLKKETVYEKQTQTSLTPAQLKRDFIDAVSPDVVFRIKDEKTKKEAEKIVGIPLYVDTLALFYNKDLFNAAGIANPPIFWNTELQKDVKAMTKQNSQGVITQSGIALGGSTNIERAPDILSVLMMQNGTIMMENGTVKFNQTPPNFENKNFNPGLDALRFYTDFGRPEKEVYCWNDSLEDSVSLFLKNKLGMIMGYTYLKQTIAAEAPKLNYAIAALPQIQGNPEINFANYWLPVVSKKTPNPDAAWTFVQFITQKDNVTSFLSKTKRPTALRALISSQLADPELEVFANQLLTSQSWYQGDNPEAAQAIMDEMIDEALADPEKMMEALNYGAKKVQQTVSE